MCSEWFTISEAVALTGYTENHLYTIAKENIPGLNFRNNDKIPKKAIEQIIIKKKFIEDECCELQYILDKLEIITPISFKNRFPEVEIYKFIGSSYISKYDAECLLEYNEFYKAEFYSKHEVIDILKLSYTTIFKNEDVLKRHIFNRTIYIAKRDVVTFQEKQNFYLNQCYTADEAAKLLGYESRGNLYRAFPQITKYLYSKKYYIPKAEIDSLISLKTIDNRYSINEVADMLKFSVGYTTELLKNIPYIKKKNLRYYLKDDINIFIEQIKQKEHIFRTQCYTQEEVLKLLCITDSTIRRKEFSELFNKRIKYNHVNHYYKSDVDDCIIKIKNSLNTKRKQNTNLEKETEVDIITVDVKNSLSSYIKMSDLSAITGIPKPFIVRAIEQSGINAIFYKHQYYISNDSIDIIKEHYSRQYLTRKQLAKKMGISIHGIDFFRKDNYLGKFFIERARGGIYIDEENIKYIKTRYIYIYFFLRCNKELSLYERIEICFNFLKDQRYCKSLNYYKKWSIDKLNNSGFNESKKQDLCHDLIYTFFRLYAQLEYLDCEIYECDNNDIEYILKTADFSEIQTRYFCQFLNYFRHKYKKICVYNRDFNVSTESENDGKDDIYSVEEWVNYYIFLTDVDSHIFNAIKDDAYAQKWLYTILHLSICWRKTDIAQMPSVQVLKDEFDFNWFNNNRLNLSQSQALINYISKETRSITFGKTGARAHFIIPEDLVIPTAHAYALCEIHRRKAERKLLFNKSKFYSTITDNHYLNKFFNESNLPSFQNRKANRTLLTCNFEYTANQEGLADVAYVLTAWLRSHKLSDKNLLPYTTAQYIQSTNSDGSFEKTAFQLFRRGMFGWQISVLLDLTYNSYNWSIEDKTKRIEELNKVYTPINVEKLSKFLLEQNEYFEMNHFGEMSSLENETNNSKDTYNSRELITDCIKKEIHEVITELITLSHEEIVEKLENISRGLAPAKIDNCQCLKSGPKPHQRQCPNHLSQSCFGCKYLIPTTYALELIEKELLRLMDDLENTPLFEENKIIKLSFIINKLFLILGESRKIFDSIEKNYFQSFINLKLLKIKHLELLTKYNLPKGWKDGLIKKC